MPMKRLAADRLSKLRIRLSAHPSPNQRFAVGISDCAKMILMLGCGVKLSP
jgi:hypothetical protein